MVEERISLAGQYLVMPAPAQVQGGQIERAALGAAARGGEEADRGLPQSPGRHPRDHRVRHLRPILGRALCQVLVR